MSEFWSWFAAAVSVITVIWVGFLMLSGVKLNHNCQYLVPVSNHPGVLTCAKKPETEKK